MTQPSWIGHELAGRYQIEGELGHGGMSAVYKATDANLPRVVAIKLIHPHLSRDTEFVRRFKAEATVLAQMRHPNIVQVFDLNQEGDTFFIVLEFVPGETLQARLKRLGETGRLMAMEEVLKIATSIGGALEYAHARDIIHRDIKPANVMLNVHGDAILTDFGIVKIIGGTQHTATGAVMGTARYMSPEQIRGQRVGAGSDIYSFGVMLYEMVGGRAPFDSDSAMTLMMMHINEPVPNVRQIRPEVPADLAAVINKALAKELADRYQTMGQLLADLRMIDTGVAAIREEQTRAAPAVQSPSDEVDLTEFLEEDDFRPPPATPVTPQQQRRAATAPPPGREVITPPPGREATASPATRQPVIPPEIRPAGGAGKKNRTLMIAGAIVAVIVIAAVFFIITSLGDGEDQSGTPVAALDTPEPTAVSEVIVPEDTPTSPPPTATDQPEAEVPPATATVPSPTATTPPPTPTETPIPVPEGMVLIPAATFVMGSNPGRTDEQPEHTVSLSSYFIDQFEVSNAAYRQCVDDGGCAQVRSGGFTRSNYRDNPDFTNYPVIGVNWNQATAYCAWAEKRLPTEAEWEYAASGADKLTWPWGNIFDAQLSAASAPDTQPVDEYPDGSSPFGLYNLAGNVGEWVQDNYSTAFYAESDGATDPVLENGSNTRVFRGGSFANTDSDYYRTSRRYNQSTTYADVDIGLRCAQDAP
jgi:serine/threonine-protein kinase